MCGYVSTVDSSVQPYGLIVPRGYDPSRPMRYDPAAAELAWKRTMEFFASALG